ncbi:MAG: hypothetical protein HY696_00255 [Deltaproteobacteria bacterium]|nr:hypothetical protein [Deltaproteobacteria bacterium]
MPTAEGTTRRLVQLCVAYFLAYVVTGFSVKYFLGSPEQGFPGFKDMEFLVYGTASATLIPTLTSLWLRWYRMETQRMVSFLGLRFPVEYLYIIPSGICTAVVIPTTTLMYTLPISVMVAMIIMRGSVIVISRLVDAVQIRQGILTKKVYGEENIAVLFAVGAIGVHMVQVKEGAFDFLHNTAAMVILGSYIVAYLIRIYIMNYYRNTTGRGAKRENKAFFAVEQISMYVALMLAATLVFFSPTLFGWSAPQIELFRNAILTPRAGWPWASFWGASFGIVAFFSVFIFMFKGRTATFTGLVNRLTSLVAGTTVTLLFYALYGGKFPSMQDWISLGFILVSIAFLTKAETRRARELVAAREIAADPTTTASTPLRAVSAL